MTVSHESKVRNLNDHSNCKIWILQCTHERSNCDIWITQCTHKRTNLQFSIPERVKIRAHVSCASVYICSAVYRRKWLEGHVTPSPKSQFRGQGIHTAISLRDLRDASLENTSGPSFELRNSNYASRCNFVYTRSKYRHSNDHSNCAFCSCVKTVKRLSRL